MKKNIRYITYCLMGLLFFGSVQTTVNANVKTLNNNVQKSNSIVTKMENKTNDPFENLDVGEGSSVGSGCGALLNNEAVSLIEDLLTMIQVLGPVLLILLTAVDFAQAVIGQDDKALSKAGSKVVKRAIATVVLLLVPTIVKALFNLDGIRGVLEESGIVDNPTCT